MMARKDFKTAAALLRPVANSPHGGPASRAAARMLAQAEAGLAPDPSLLDESEGDEETPPTPESWSSRRLR